MEPDPIHQLATPLAGRSDDLVLVYQGAPPVFDHNHPADDVHLDVAGASGLDDSRGRSVERRHVRSRGI